MQVEQLHERLVAAEHVGRRRVDEIGEQHRSQHALAPDPITGVAHGVLVQREHPEAVEHQGGAGGQAVGGRLVADRRGDRGSFEVDPRRLAGSTLARRLAGRHVAPSLGLVEATEPAGGGGDQPRQEQRPADAPAQARTVRATSGS